MYSIGIDIASGEDETKYELRIGDYIFPITINNKMPKDGVLLVSSKGEDKFDGIFTGFSNRLCAIKNIGISEDES